VGHEDGDGDVEGEEGAQDGRQRLQDRGEGQLLLLLGRRRRRRRRRRRPDQRGLVLVLMLHVLRDRLPCLLVEIEAKSLSKRHEK
jgi:hypothetical protein